MYRRSTLEIPRDDKVLLHLLHHVIDGDQFAVLVDELYAAVGFYRGSCGGSFLLGDALELPIFTGLLEVLLTADIYRLWRGTSTFLPFDAQFDKRVRAGRLPIHTGTALSVL